MDETTTELLNMTVDWFLRNLRTEEHGSLQAISADADGNRTGRKFTAKDDGQMFQYARTMIRQEKGESCTGLRQWGRSPL